MNKIICVDIIRGAYYDTTNGHQFNNADEFINYMNENRLSLAFGYERIIPENVEMKLWYNEVKEC